MLNEEQISQVVSEFKRNGKIAAVKKYREFESSSLRDAKSAVEQLAAGEGQIEGRGESEGDQLEDSAMDLILDAIQDGNKVLAIKHYREATGKSLRNSKTFVEALMSELEIADPDAVGSRGCVVALMLIGLPIGIVCICWLSKSGL